MLHFVAQAMEYARFIEVKHWKLIPLWIWFACLHFWYTREGRWWRMWSNSPIVSRLPKSFTVDDVKDALEATGIV